MLNLLRFHFGLSTRTGECVSDQAFAAFLADQVSPRFPGFTVLHGSGYWQGIPERSVVLEVLTDQNDLHSVRAIVSAYCAQFDQDDALFYALFVGANNLSTETKERLPNMTLQDAFHMLSWGAWNSARTSPEALAEVLSRATDEQRSVYADIMRVTCDPYAGNEYALALAALMLAESSDKTSYRVVIVDDRHDPSGDYETFDSAKSAIFDRYAIKEVPTVLGEATVASLRAYFEKHGLECECPGCNRFRVPLADQLEKVI